MTLRLPDFSTARVLVTGDLMLDRYWHGPTSRISPEAPVPVVHIHHTEARPGGAGNVALNAVALGARATVVGVTGNDEAADNLAGLLEAHAVTCLFHRLDAAATVTKLRVISQHQQLIRLDFEDGFPGYDTGPLTAQYRDCLADADVVVLSDYGKGTLQPVQELIRLARQAGKPVLVDPKSLDFSIYRGASLVTPNLAEFEAVVGACEDEAALVDKGMALLASHAFDGLLITRGEHGMTLLRVDEEPVHVPTQAREVFDVTGAGDTVIAVLATAMAAGTSLPDAMALANVAAGIVVGKLGTATVEHAEFRQALATTPAIDAGGVSESQLLLAVEQAHARGESIVMTNGCFDILHAGHVEYLAAARQLGDRLIVALNDDDSVRRLKGDDRPVNPLANRRTVLAALSSVDWVVPFGSDTPRDLICKIKPDILVKGGDYRVEEIAGHDCVLANGGEVRILPFTEGCSTSALIDSIRDNSE